MRRVLKSFVFVLALLPVVSQAWWNEDWSQRTKVVLNTTEAGVAIKNPVNNLPVALRLHSGNFDFASAKEDGSDLRLVAGDDKTPLKFHIEHFDSLNELAVLWVQLPVLAAGSDKNLIYAYAGNPAAVAESSAAETYDASHLAVWHFAEKDAAAVDAKSGLKTLAPVPVDANGILGNAARLNGVDIIAAPGERIVTAAGGALTVSFWIKPGQIEAGDLYHQGALKLQLVAGKLQASIGALKLSGGEIKAGAWQAVAFTAGSGKAVLYLDGVVVAQADLNAPELAGDIRVGAAYTGLLDELQLANVARSADFIKAGFAAQGNEGKLVLATREAQGEEASEGDAGYMGILVQNLTHDAWAVIIILLIMFVISCWVMVSKGMMIAKAEKANLAFLRKFREVGDDVLLTLKPTPEMQGSSLYRLYEAGVRETNKRFAARAAHASIGAAATHVLGGASIDAIKATIDADQVRENHKLNSLMVLLTIAISGGPFLGLLGTVVGVMITFAAIAAAGDVNVNAIAPGIAAALLATVAGLGVAIPALFGYNWLAAKIKNISADMQIFVDELVTRIAEIYGD